jgi:hypothetical protein
MIILVKTQNWVTTPAIGGRNVLSMGYIHHCKMVRTCFFCYSVMTIFPLKAKKKSLGEGIFCLLKKWTVSYSHAIGREKKNIHKGASPSFLFFFKQYNGRINMVIKKNKGYLQGCFGVFRLVLLLFLSFFLSSLFSLLFSRKTQLNFQKNNCVVRFVILRF